MKGTIDIDLLLPLMFALFCILVISTEFLVLRGNAIMNAIVCTVVPILIVVGFVALAVAAVGIAWACVKDVRK